MDGTQALTATRTRQLVGLPGGDDVLDFRDCAILKTYLYTAVRLARACRLRVKDFHQDGEHVTLTINEKGQQAPHYGYPFRRRGGYIRVPKKAGLETGSIFRARRAPHSQ